MRLAEQGLLEEAWQPSETPGRPPRHVYRLTKSGIATARALVQREPATGRRLRLSRASR